MRISIIWNARGWRQRMVSSWHQIVIVASPSRCTRSMSVLSCLQRISAHQIHSFWNMLKNLHQLIVKFVFCLDFIPRWVLLVVDLFEVLEVTSIFGFFHLDVTNLLQFIVIDKDAWNNRWQLRLSFLCLIRSLEANESTGEIRVWHNFYALDITIRREYVF